MLSLQDKEQQWESFRDSPKFGRHTWITTQLFDINARHLIETVGFYLTLASKKQDRRLTLFLEEDGNNGTRSQYIVLDAIAKIQTLIETTLVLIEAISHGYSSIAKTMAYYDQRLPCQTLEKIPIIATILGRS